MESIENLGKMVIGRRRQLGLSQLEVWRAGGPSNSTLTGIEQGSATTVSASTLRKLDTALRWEPGSAARVLAGGEPESLPSPGLQAAVEATGGRGGGLKKYEYRRRFGGRGTTPDELTAAQPVTDPERAAKLTNELAELVSTLSYLERDAPPSAPIESLRVIVDRDLAEMLPELVLLLTPQQRGELSRIVLEKLVSQDRDPRLDAHFAEVPEDDAVSAHLESLADERQDTPARQSDFDLAANRHFDEPTQGELRRRPGRDAGEENQEPTEWEGA